MKKQQILAVIGLTLLLSSPIYGMLRHSCRLLPRTSVSMVSKPHSSLYASRYLTSDDNDYQMVDNKLVCPEGKPVNLVSLHQDITDLQEQIDHLHIVVGQLILKDHFKQPLMIDDQELKIEKYQQILSLHPDTIAAMYNVAYSLKKLGRLEELQKIKAQEEQRRDD